MSSSSDTFGKPIYSDGDKPSERLSPSIQSAKLNPEYHRGDKIDGHYLVDDVREGTWGKVYLCLDLETNGLFALKTIQAKFLADKQERDLFNQEVERWLALESHPNIVECLGFDWIDNQPIIFLEWIAGENNITLENGGYKHEKYVIPEPGVDLQNFVKTSNNKRLDLRLALDFIIDVCRGLIHAGQKYPDIVHGDLKPNNILIAQGTIAKITDFGLANTPAYKAPELWHPESLDSRTDICAPGCILDSRTDIYALGCILYEILTGKHPFYRGVHEDWRQEHLHTPAPNLPSQLNLPPSLNEVVKRCLAKQKDDRFGNVGELLDMLSQIYQQQFSEMPRELPSVEQFTAQKHINRGISYSQLWFYSEQPFKDLALNDFNKAIYLDPTNIAAYANRGIAYVNAGRYEDALADFDLAIELAPDNPEIYNNRGFTYWIMHRYEDALADFDRVISLNPNHAEAYNGRGNVNFDQKRYPRALADYSRVIELKPDYALAYYHRGNTYVELQRYDEALKDLTQAINFTSGQMWKAYHNRGSLYRKLQRYDEALTDFNQAIDLAPVRAEGYNDRGLVYENLRRCHEAEKDYTQAIKLDPTDAKALSNRGNIYAKLQDYDKSLADFNRAIELAPEYVEAYVNRAATYTELQRYETALADYTQAIKINPNLALAYANRGILHSKLEQSSAALKDFSRAIELDPQDAEVYFNRGVIFHDMQRYDEALADYTQAIKLNTTDPDAYNNRGIIYGTLGHYEKALADFNQALELNPTNVQARDNRNKVSRLLAEAFYNQGLARQRLGELQSAHQDLTKAIELEPNYTAAYQTLGIVFSELGMHEAAISEFDKAVELEKTNARIYYDRALAYSKKYDYEAAMTDYLHVIKLDPTLQRPYYNVGIVLIKLNRLDDALRYMRKALQMRDSKAEPVIHWLEQVKHEEEKTSFVINLADSKEEIKVLCKYHPFMRNPNFILLLQEAIEQNPLINTRKARERLEWLKQLSDNQVIASDQSISNNKYELKLANETLGQYAILLILIGEALGFGIDWFWGIHFVAKIGVIIVAYFIGSMVVGAVLTDVRKFMSSFFLPDENEIKPDIPNGCAKIVIVLMSLLGGVIGYIFMRTLVIPRLPITFQQSILAFAVIGTGVILEAWLLGRWANLLLQPDPLPPASTNDP